MKNKPNNNAFTLVELIVVIVILAILATIAFLSFSSQSGSARDSTRLSDISSIKKSVEMYNVNAWTYPAPDKPFSYTYSWGIIWNQWTIWDSAYKILQKNLSKKVVDPLKWSEYDYSLASNKREYQVAWNFENPTSFERNYNPFDSSALSPKLSALGWTWVNVYISWNYNWVMLKVFTWSTYYFVPTPTLFWIWTWSTVYDNTFWSWKDLLPWVNNAAVFDSSKVYASTSSTWLSAAEVESLMVTIQSAYLTWNVATPAVQEVLAATWSALTDLWVWLVKNSLGWWTTASTWGSWVIDPPAPADSTITSLFHFEWNYLNSWVFTWAITNHWTSFDATSAVWLWQSVLFNWTNNYLIINWSSDWNFWSSDFTIDLWVNPTWAWEIISKRSSWQTNWFTVTMAWGNYIFAWAWLWWDASLTFWSADYNAWTHIAVARKWSNIYLFKNWYLGRIISTGTAITTNSDEIAIWLDRVWAGYFAWKMDELRLSNTAKWDWASYTVWQKVFTPSTNPY
ncbi:MAG: hypothetical protein ACD_2C00151G0001 [uncultured bacterium (gcode 4)]|uniref:Uncharacterized protein n=1 Tax=uncultured bacterium (gcode 4) TaxID=1234023 RepID=K2FEE1_9BACT|nr:MAG: hypothetical protein ACD_2C00151G0001 [uncultured bacterium (gcode 4)]